MNYDVIIIGAGHAGCEAALAAARLGAKTAVFCLSLDTIANLPCNPSIGGSAKGQIVSEIDALGGEMGRAADASLIQSRTLNKGKGAAVHALRAQCDRTEYHLYMKKALERQENLDIKQDEVRELIIEPVGADGSVRPDALRRGLTGEQGRSPLQSVAVGVKTRLGLFYGAKAVVIATGTYLDAEIHIGENSFPSGADGVLPSTGFGASLEEAGIKLRRFKTGTPARINRRSVDFTKMQEQGGDDVITPFSFAFDGVLENFVPCHITYTNAETHRVIRENLHRSPLYGGRINLGRGPRYCPSIEDKIVRFADKERHQVFVEPMGLHTDEMYLQGLSSSLPVEVQEEFIRTIAGLENAEIMRHAYAIEYLCCDPSVLYATLEFKSIGGLFSAGQFNATSGYEEAAGQGLIAGVNAARKVMGREPYILPRSSSYIGTLIDDLVTKGCDEPYRMMTSRSEYRLLLRQDNAPERLAEIGHELGLLGRERFQAFRESREIIQNEIKRLKKTTAKPTPLLNKILEKRGTTPITNGVRIADILKRPEIGYDDLIEAELGSVEIPPRLRQKIEIEVKYEGYIRLQLEQIRKTQGLEDKKLPADADYRTINGLSTEAAEKLNRHKPLNIGQAGRVSGVNPADVAVLLVWLSAK
ncbi:MAG: tRNA uridine-5-carboxymethylaminomethyl(34) synthesis enzyme MnmG [Oscillospiraceae bacterium]|nr:tRNA uridine-5-carboxymethylaminomethyl(34) synthesis enzyme MnmG [Oscillospiraceae bacterium]